jgi:drug/metabolite transporter (DMT)-like permease
MQLLAQLTGPLQGVRTLAPTEPRQSGGSRRFNQTGEFNKHYQVSVCDQRFNRLVEGPLVQGIDQIERRMTATPIEHIRPVAHDPTCPVNGASVCNLYNDFCRLCHLTPVAGARHERRGDRWPSHRAVYAGRAVRPRRRQHLVWMDCRRTSWPPNQPDALGIAALRFGVAGIILLPYVLVKGLALERLGGVALAVIVVGGAAPVLLANSGLLFASAAHAGALFPGVMPLMVALLAAAFLQETFTKAKKIGFTLILPGVLGIAWGSEGGIGSSANVGDVLFLGSGLAWALYTIAMRRARIGGLHAAAISAVGAMLLYLPVFMLTAGTTLAEAPWSDIVLQGFVQGILTAIISLLLYGRAVGILGASSGAAFAALCPAMTAVLGIPILGEGPNATEWIAIITISAGVYVVSGGPLPRRTRCSGPRHQAAAFQPARVTEP